MHIETGATKMNNISYHEFREETKDAENRILEGDIRRKYADLIDRLSSSNRLWQHLESAMMKPGNKQTLVQHFFNSKKKYEMVEVVEVWETLLDICEEEFYL
jgi:hypothetical protein